MAISFEQLKLTASARPLVDQALARASSPADVAKVKEALIAAAKTNGNTVLSADEVKAVVDAFDAVAPRTANGAAAPLTPAQMGQGIELAHTQLKSMESLSNLDGVSVHFTFQESLEKKMISELNATVARANGRPVELNMMIFEFQSDGIEKAIHDVAKNNPNVKVRIIADSGQASAGGGNALPSLLEAKLPNVEVKFKKDFPYVWSDSKGAPVYNHGATKGLNHHKGFSSTIDGRPDVLLTGSFNWSNTADTKNYEDLTVFTGVDAASRRPIEQYTDEFAAFWNNDDAALSPNAFANFKKEQYDAMLVAHGKPKTQWAIRTPESYAKITVPQDLKSIDLNGFRTVDQQRLAKAIGTALAREVVVERNKNGRFASLDELKERVPKAATLAPDKLEALVFGSGRVSINAASREELDLAGFLPNQAAAIVAHREKHGDFESIEDLARVPGITKGRLDAMREKLTALDLESFFNSRPFTAPVGGTGYGAGGSRTTLAVGADGTVSAQKASVTVAATDLFNKAKPGEQISVAMYGMSGTAPEFKALVEAAKRGVQVRVVLNEAYTATTVAAIGALKAQGLPVDVRVQTAKTMHEKFGVVGDDAFFGSANFSESSSTKHSEDRFAVKNHPEISSQFQSQFELLWAKSRIVT